MPDIYCRVCLEPWDLYGVNHGDMKPWEARLFRKGAGCPCCEGVQPEGLSDDDAFDEWGKQMLFDGPDDPDDWMEEVHVESAGGDYKRPEWRPPEPEALWVCKGCNVRAVRDHEEDEGTFVTPKPPLVWDGGDDVHGYHGAMYRWAVHPNAPEEPPEKPEFEIAGEPYCDGCAKWCDECQQVAIFRRSELEGDSYDAGSAFEHPHTSRKTVCITCLEEFPQCSDCMNYVDSSELDEDGLCSSCQPEEDD